LHKPSKDAGASVMFMLLGVGGLGGVLLMEVHAFVLHSVDVPVGTVVDMTLTFGGVLLTPELSSVGAPILLAACIADFCDVPRGLKAMGFLKDGDESLPPSLCSTSLSFRNFAGFRRFLGRLVRFSPSLSSLVLSTFDVYKSLSALLLASDKVPTYTHASMEVSKHNNLFIYKAMIPTIIHILPEDSFGTKVCFA